MKPISTAKSYVSNQRVIGFAQEMKRLEEWLVDPVAETQLFSVSGIGGIGKTTLLMEMAQMSRASSALTLWLDGQGELATSGAFLSSLEMSLESEYGRVRALEIPLLSYIISELSQQRTVLIMDNCESMDRMEGWLLSSFLPKLKNARVLLVFASRNGLSVKWYTNPYWGTHIQAFPLTLFTREEVHEFLRRSNLEAKVQMDIAQKTEGHPLLLALAVDLLRHQGGEIQPKLNEISGILSAEILREVTSPTLYHALSILSLLPVADQSTLNLFLEVPLDIYDYHELGKLSFVRVTPQGLSLHDVVSRLLRQDYVARNPGEFQALRQKVFKFLVEQFHAVDKRLQMHITAHVLELYREFLPTTHVYADFSSILKPREHRAFQSEDLPYLHQFLAASVAQSDWQSELVRAEDYHSLLDDIARHCPEGICIVRNENGVPLAFCAGLWIHALTQPLLERYTPRFLPMLGEEGDQLHNVPPEEADSICILLAAVDVSQSIYRPEELGALLMQQWLIYMTSGLRGVMVTADPQLNRLLPIVGFKEIGRVGESDSLEVEMTKWELDFRQITFDEWVQNVIRQMGAEADEQISHYGKDSDVTIKRSDVKQILHHLFNVRMLEQIPVIRQLNMTGDVVQKQVQEILTVDPPVCPLTPLEQRILRESFLQKDLNKSQLAAAFHMSRTTFYRHSQLAMSNLAHVLTRSFSIS